MERENMRRTKRKYGKFKKRFDDEWEITEDSHERVRYPQKKSKRSHRKTHIKMTWQTE